MNLFIYLFIIIIICLNSLAMQYLHSLHQLCMDRSLNLNLNSSVIQSYSLFLLQAKSSWTQNLALIWTLQRWVKLRLKYLTNMFFTDVWLESPTHLQVFLSLVLQEISIVLQRHQYHDVMELLESFDRMSRNSTFRKYKPNVLLHAHARDWYVKTTLVLQSCFH